MRYLLLPFIFASFSLLNTGCEKETFRKSNPEITELKQIDHNVLRVSVGFNPNASFEQFGLCYSTQPTPDITDEVVYFKRGTSYTENITGIKKDVTYYFRAFTTSKKDKVLYGTIQSYTIASNEPPAAPCGPGLDAVYLNGINYTPLKGYHGAFSSFTTGEYEIRLVDYSGNKGPELTFYFGYKPVTGTYAVTSLGMFMQKLPVGVKWNKTTIKLFNGYKDIYLGSFGNVYITENADGTYKVEFCDIRYVESANYEVTARGNFSTN